MSAITNSIEQSIAELINKLAKADRKESARIHARIDELEKLKEQYAT
jgi:hypothetical protein